MARINVLVVDDSVVIRRLVTTALEADPDIAVVGTAANGRIALAKLSQVAPDLVTLDVEMPELDGIGTLRELRKTHPRLPVIMFSTLTERGAATTLDALALGASDYVTKPSNVGSVPEALAAVRQQLIPKIKALCPARVPLPRSVAPSRPSVPAGWATTRPAGARTRPVELLVIGASTGGPDALTAVLPRLPLDLGVPAVLVQHMPPVFTRLFAQRLDGKCPYQVKEAENGDVLRPGLLLVAPGDFHVTLQRRGDQTRVLLNQDPPENFCRPAVDVLFRSAAETYGAGSLAVVLTGMGQDGVRGADRIRAVGGEVVAQDEASSVVWGMPGAVVNAGLADRVLPLRSVADDITAAVRRSRGTSPAPRPALPPAPRTSATSGGSR